jgi:hypothetical protein
MSLLRRAWEGWKRVGQYIGDAIARVVLTLFYFTLFAPFGLGVRLWGDPLKIEAARRAVWLERDTHQLHLDDARRLF